MRCFNAHEVKLSSFMLGVLMLLWAVTIGLDTENKLYMMLDLWQSRWIFVIVMSLTGACLVIGGIFPWRSLRHMGLWLTPMSTFPAFGLMLENGMAGVRTITLPFLGAMALFIWFSDARGKQRHAKVDT